jgi:hypothetical protein
MKSHPYHVICSVGTTAGLDHSALKEIQRTLVLLAINRRGDEPTGSFRGGWGRDAKADRLFKSASLKGLHSRSASGCGACSSMFASRRTLIDTRQWITCHEGGPTGLPLWENASSRRVPTVGLSCVHAVQKNKSDNGDGPGKETAACRGRVPLTTSSSWLPRHQDG